MNDLNANGTRNTGSPVLDAVPKSDPFVVAPGFFERFPHEVQTLAVHQQQRTALFPWRTVAVGLASGCVIGMCAWLLWPSTSNDRPQVAEVAITPLSNEELDAMDDGDLLAIAEEVEPATVAQDLGQVHLDLNESELIAFLEHENTDINELLDYQ